MTQPYHHKPVQNIHLQPISYQKSHCRVGVLHIGVGAFHRSHQAYYFHQLLAQGYSNWGIVGINLYPETSTDLKRLQVRDNDYVLKTISPTGEAHYEEICSIIETIDNVHSPLHAQSVLANPEIQLITLTISESGYHLTADSNLHLGSPCIVRDLADTGKMMTIYGYLRKSLQIRKQTINMPITIVCCDNIIHNGEVLENAFKQYLHACDDNILLQWVNEKVSFPCSMVDRITPKLSGDLSQEIATQFHIENDNTVLSESYIQWSIEDNFKGTKPPLGKVGVEFVTDIDMHEQLKIKLLNGGHTAIAYMAALSGYTHFDKAFKDAKLYNFLLKLQQEDIMPTITDLSKEKVKEYQQIVLNRFANPYISDTITRICMDGYAKIQFFILPSIKQRMEQNHLPKYAIQSLAYWYMFLHMILDGSLKFHYQDAHFSFLMQVVQQSTIDQFSRTDAIWGDIPRKYPVFCHHLSNSIFELMETENNGTIRIG